DAVAYLNHDIADAIRAGLLTEEELPEIVQVRIGRRHSQRVNTLVCDIVEASWAATGEVPGDEAPTIKLSPRILEATNTLREFMFERVYLWEGRQRESERAKRVVRFLYEYYVNHPQEIQSDFALENDPVWRRALDYIGGMTDVFALRRAEELGFLD
ncbi:MAG TPA: deoxyguanosinetriphosphate triphosphohydrolase, partial [Dehalococcoidia bacterium]|nr:deoxyguanosinetriphosphate triphosphohydrolase [Dehalococcoidia bacterium]